MFFKFAYGISLFFICLRIASTLAIYFHVRLLEMLDFDQGVGQNQSVLLDQIEALNFVISHELKIKERGKINPLFCIHTCISVSLQHSLILYPLLHVRVFGYN